MHLQFALNYLARARLLAGDLTAAALMIEEDHLIAAATGNPPAAHTKVMLAAWRGREPEAAELIESTVREGTARGLGRLADGAAYASSVLYNGLGRHDAACDAARRAFEHQQLGHGPLVVPELAEAAARTGEVDLVRAALEWLSERTRVMPTEWALGIEARLRALLAGAGPPRAATASRSSAWAGRPSAPNSPALTCSTGNGCAASAAAARPASSCAPPTTCWTRWAWRHLPNEPGASSRRPARALASGPWRRPSS